MSNFNSSFNPAVFGGQDNLQDIEGFQYNVSEGSPTEFSATPATPSNSVQYVNKSPCPIKLTVTTPPVDPDTGKPPVVAEDEEAPEPTEHSIVICPGETLGFKFDKPVILDATIGEAVPAPDDALTPDDNATIRPKASVDLSGALRFSNC